MTLYVVDASVAVKWVVEEPGTQQAMALLNRHELAAPDLILAECANIFWKKVWRRELSLPEARFAALMIEGSDLQLREMLPIWLSAIELAAQIDHPAYDCLYLALAQREGLQFVTADESLVRKLGQSTDRAVRKLAVPLSSFA
ncbi:type II toxin-antitoxin system VapC family toxin [Neorhizobium sp. DAR64861/K0K2]|uniref:type II toxin-antitoxin system VapC family toxin n=1 Tax=unclassified Neorhizobium TaxID=2629175 RepID=UPI003D2D1A7D